jgi:hypothetical protein
MIEMTEKTFVECIWFVPFGPTPSEPVGDLLAILFREGEGPWGVSIRMRVYDGDQTRDAFNDGDTKKAWRIEPKPGAFDSVGLMADDFQGKLALLAITMSDGPVTVIERLDIQGGPKDVVAALKTVSWAHLQEHQLN